MSARRAGGVLRVAAAAIRREDGAVLLALRPRHANQGGKWEFPGGKLEPRESAVAGLARELDEELGIAIEAATPLITVRHDYPDRRIELLVFEVRAWRGEPHGREGQAVEWVAAEDLARREFPAANLPILAALRLPRVLMITPDVGADEGAFLARLERCLEAGVELVQLRITAEGARRARLARRAIELAQSHAARLVLNGVPEEVLALGAHGVHLNRARLLACAERPLPRELLVSAACHDAAALEHAARLEIDCALVSPVAPTTSHPGAPVLGWRALRGLTRAARSPVYALGGLRAADVGRALRAGCQGVALLSGLWNATEPAEVVARATREVAAAALSAG